MLQKCKNRGMKKFLKKICFEIPERYTFAPLKKKASLAQLVRAADC